MRVVVRDFIHAWGGLTTLRKLIHWTLLFGVYCVPAQSGILFATAGGQRSSFIVPWRVWCYGRLRSSTRCACGR